MPEALGNKLAEIAKYVGEIEARAAAAESTATAATAKLEEFKKEKDMLLKGLEKIQSIAGQLVQTFESRDKKA